MKIKRVIVFMVLVAMAGCFGLGLWTSSLYFVSSQSRGDEVVSLPPLVGFNPKLVDVFTFGHKAIYDAFLSIWVTQVFADPRLGPEHADKVVEMVKNMSRHRPRLEKTLYVAACMIFVQRLGRPDLCFQVTELGMDTLSESWMIPFTQGFVEGALLKNKGRAAFFYFLASQKKGVPDFVSNVAFKLREEAGDLSEQEYLDSLNKMLNAPGGERFLEFLKGTLSRGQSDE